MFQIQEMSPVASAASITFNVPPTFRHLHIITMIRGSDAAATVNLLIRFNADAGANYDWHRVEGTAGAGNFANALAATSAQIAVMPAAGAAANLHSYSRTDIFDYSFTTREKMLQTLTSEKDGVASNANLHIGMYMGAWRNTAAITSFTLLASAGNVSSGLGTQFIGVYGSGT